jgi:hypothetical protein
MFFLKNHAIRERERERTGCFCKRFFFLLSAPGSALEKFAAIVTLRTNLLK